MYLSNSHTRRDLPIPAAPTTDTRWARPSSPVACSVSLISRSWRSRPTNGGSSPVTRMSPRAPATTRAARQSWTGSDLPFSSWAPASSYSIAASVARFVASPTKTLPGEAADCTRDAVFTRSPATMPWSLAPSVTAASPVSTPARARRFGAPASSPSAATASIEVERGADGALGIVLVRHRRAPDRHHGVADELLDHAAVALDDAPAGLEVAPSGARGPLPSRGPPTGS